MTQAEHEKLCKVFDRTAVLLKCIKDIFIYPQQTLIWREVEDIQTDILNIMDELT
jgi:hypothetical protein